jgi:predicted GH43/DUF377 family glycosyl hydrolase
MKTLLKTTCYTWLLLLLSVNFSNAQTDSSNVLPNWALGGFTRIPKGNPIITPDSNSFFYCPMNKKSIAWQSNDTFNPAAILKAGKIVVLYRAEDKSGVGIGFRTSRIGYAESSNGIDMKRSSKPVMYPGRDNQKETDWPGGCEDPRVAVTQNGTYVMFYTAWNRKVARLSVATSRDLKHWTKHGPAFAKAYQGKYKDMFTKSASILTKLEGNKVVVTKVNGKFFIYWGEQHVYAATSTNLTDWKPLEDGKGNLKILMSPRKGFFDSSLTECGPPALLTKNGVILLYNGKNAADDIRDTMYTANSYCAGQALFDAKHPTKFITRLNKPFLRPRLAYEKSGQYVNGTVFIEGLVYFKQQWFLYYGCADSKVSVAIYDPRLTTQGDPLPN